jgi:hypothetical protein
VVAEIAGEEHWIDPTISFQGGGITDNRIPDYGYGLVIRPGETEPVALPQEQTDPGEVTAHYDYVFSDDGATALVEITTEFTGMEADSQRYDLADTTIEELQTGYQSYYSTASGRVVVVEPLEVTDDRLSNSIITRESYRLEDWWDEIEGEPTFELLPLLLADVLRTEDLADRRAPLEISRRSRRFETVRIGAPPDWDLGGVETEIGDPWFDYRVTSSSDDGALLMDHQLIVGDRPVPPAEIASYNSAVQNMTDAAYYSIAFENGGLDADVTPALIALAIVLAVSALAFLLVGWLLFRWRLL